MGIIYNDYQGWFAIISIMIRTIERTASLPAVVHSNLENFLDQQTFTWNCALEERIGAWKKAGKSISAFDQMKSLTQVRAADEWFAKYHLSSQRTVLLRQDKAFKSFLRRVRKGEKPGYPRFKSSSRKVRSFESGSLKINRAGYRYYVSIKGIGKFRFKEKVEGEVKLIRVVRTARRVKLQFIVELPDTAMADERSPVGIDMGVKSRIALSTGEHIPKRSPDRTQLKKLQRKVSRAKKGSNSRKKKVVLLRKEHQRVSERNRGELHELTAKLVKEHSARFYLENLKVQNMTAKGGRHKRALNRSINDQTWGHFQQLLSYKAESAGGFVQKVSPHNTSQACSVCGGMPKERLELKVRTYRCAHCGHVQDRDVNAAINILHVGMTGISAGTAGARGEGGSMGFNGSLTAQNSMQWSGDHCI